MDSAIKISYHKRLFLILLAFSWFIILCCIGFQYQREKEYRSELITVQLRLFNQHILEAYDDGFALQEYVESQDLPFEGLRISVITLSGEVVYDNTLSLDSLDNHRYRPEIDQAIKDGVGYHIKRISTSDGREYFYVATRGDNILVRTAIPYTASLQELLKAEWDFLIFMILISLVMSALAYFATRRLGNTIKRLNRFAAKAEKERDLTKTSCFQTMN